MRRWAPLFALTCASSLGSCNKSGDAASERPSLAASEPDADAATDEAPEDEPAEEPSADADECPGCTPNEDLEPGRIDAFAAAACGKKDYELAFAEYQRLAGNEVDDARTRVVFAAWLYIADEHEVARERLAELENEADAALELAVVQNAIAQMESDCLRAQKHDRRAQRLLGGDAGNAPRPTIWIDFPRVIATDTRALAAYFHGLQLRRCTTEPPLEAFERALDYDPGFAPALTRIGELHVKAGDLDAAAEAWTAAIAAQPDHAEAHILLGHLRESQCRFDEALPLLDRGWQLNPFDTAIAAYDLCFAYTRAGRFDDASRACKTYASANPYEPDADELYLMGNLLVLTPEVPALTVREMDAANCPIP